MKIKEFTYTKANGDTSKRTLVELVCPTTVYEGIDVSELSDDDFAEFVTKLNQQEKVIQEMRMALYAEFDLTHNYRRFSTERMSDVTTEYN